MTFSPKLSSLFLMITTVMLCIYTSSCDNQGNQKETEITQSNATDKPVTDTLTANPKIVFLTRKSSPCTNNDCTRINISYPRISNNQVEQYLVQRIKESISSNAINDAESTQLGDIMDQFIKDYEAFVQAFPSAATPWSIDLRIEQTFRADDFSTFRMKTNSYTGGAHANERVEYFNLKTNGEPITRLGSLLKDYRSIEKLAETSFRKQKGLTAGESLSAAGYTFEKDQFELSTNFGFTEEGLVFYYNNYEIAAYSSGSTSITIPMEQITGLIKFD